MRLRRLRRWMVFALIGAVGVYVVLDVVALRYVESRGATQIAQAMTAEDAKVDLGAIPFIPSLVNGRRPSATVRVRGATGPGGLRVARVELRLSDLRFKPRRIVALMRSRFAQKTTVRAGQAVAEVQIRSRDLRDYLRDKGLDVYRVRIDSGGVSATFRAVNPITGRVYPRHEDPDRSARFLPRVEGGVFKLQLVSVARLPYRFRDDALQAVELVSLPKFPPGLRTDIRLGKGVFVIEESGVDLERSIGEAAT